MKGAELRALRQAVGVNQKDAADALGVSVSFLASMERGTKPVPEEVERAALTRLMDTKPDEGGRELALTLCLGEAVLMLSEDERECLYARASRTLIQEAVTKVAQSRVNGSLAEAVASRDREIDELRYELDGIKGRLREACK